MVHSLVKVMREMDNAFLAWRAEQADREKSMGSGTSGRTVGKIAKTPK